jgi:hypothetical protein
MKFLLLCCIEEAAWLKLSEEKRAGVMDNYGRFAEELKANGKLLAGAALEPTATALCVRTRDGKPWITDGPFAETREQIGGYHLIECRDRDEAVAIALRIPSLAVGGKVEVRAVRYTE